MPRSGQGGVNVLCTYIPGMLPHSWGGGGQGVMAFLEAATHGGRYALHGVTRSKNICQKIKLHPPKERVPPTNLSKKFFGQTPLE